MENNLYYISGYWKDNRSTFENYLVSEAEDTESDDDNVFFYGLSMEEAMAYMFEEDAPFEFVITSVQPFTQHHSCLTWSKEDFNGDEQLMNRFFTDCNEMIIQSINEMKEQWMREYLVTIYYNDVFVSEKPFEIYANCPYVNIPLAIAEEYAEQKIENKEWDAYCIPELVRDHEVVFHES